MAAPRNRRPINLAAARPLQVYHELPSPGRLLTGGLLTKFAGNPERGERPPDDKRNPNYDRDGKRRSEDERKPRYKIELLARTYLGDVGIRPVSDPNLVFWESPDIWIDGPSNDPDQATPGVLNTVMVHVWNLGLADCWAAHVEVFWCDPSVGVSPALATPIGSTVTTLMGGEHKVLSFPWVPSMSNGGHECLVAQAYDPVSDPLVAPFNPTLDRHVAQRNISVVEAPSGKPFQLNFAIPNLTIDAMNSTLSVELLAGAPRKRFLTTIGAPQWRASPRAVAPSLVPLALRRIPWGDPVLRLATGALRERLDSEPGRVAVRRVATSLQMAAAAAGSRVQSRGRFLSKATWEFVARGEEGTRGLVRGGTPERGGAPSLGVLTVQPHSVMELALRGKAAGSRGAEERDVYRVVERINGRVTGGITVIVKAPAQARRGVATVMPRRQKARKGRR